MTTSEPNGLDLIKEVEKKVTLDTYLDRDPKLLTDEDIKLGLIKHMRMERAMFIAKREAKKEK